MQIDLTIIALGIAAVAAPASASTSAQVSATAQNGNGHPVAAQEKKYCIQYEQMVGSRVNRQDCKTKRQWARDGVDVDKLLNK